MDPSGNKARILVVDDEPSIIELLGEYLKARGYQVMVASDGEQALGMLDKHPVDVVLTDMKMPKVDGLHLLATLAERHTPVATILMTGFGTIDSAIRAMKNGAQDYILKPFRLREVHSAILRAENRVRLEREAARLRDVLALYRAVHEIEAPEDLHGLYQKLATAVPLELDADGAIVAFRAEQLGGWVEVARSHDAAVACLDVQAAGDAAVDGTSLDPASAWHDGSTTPVVVAPIHLQANADSTLRPAGFVAVIAPADPDAAARLRTYARIVGEAASRQLLSTWTRRKRERAAGTLPQTGEQVAAVVSRAAVTAGMDSSASDLALEAARLRWLPGGPPELEARLGEAREGLDREDLRGVLEAIDERFDGRGSPAGLKEDDIPLPAQLIAAAEHWAFLTGDCDHMVALAPELARTLLEGLAGSRLHPSAVAAVLAATS